MFMPRCVNGLRADGGARTGFVLHHHGLAEVGFELATIHAATLCPFVPCCTAAVHAQAWAVISLLE